MAKKTSFAHQKDLLGQLSKMLSEFEQDLKLLSQKYENNVYALYEGQGLMEEVFTDYDKMYLQPMKQALQDLSERVISQDIPFVEKEIDFFCSH